MDMLYGNKQVLISAVLGKIIFIGRFEIKIEIMV